MEYHYGVPRGTKKPGLRRVFNSIRSSGSSSYYRICRRATNLAFDENYKSNKISNLRNTMGTIIGMIAPHKVTFSVEITSISGIFRKPRRRALQTGITVPWDGTA